MKYIFIISLIIFQVSGDLLAQSQLSERFVKLVDEARPRVKYVPIDSVLIKLEKKSGLLLLDVRERNEWNEGHIGSAIHLSKGILERDIEKTTTDLNKEIILVCGSGARATLAADNLQKMGFTNVWVLTGGMNAWKEKKLTVTTD